MTLMGTKLIRTAKHPRFNKSWLQTSTQKSQIVLSGNIGGIRTLLIQLRQFIGHDPHAISHNPIMAPAADYMRLALERIKITFPASVTCISNISALPFQSKENLRNLPSEQCVGTMRWWDSIKYLDQGQAVKR